MATIDVSYINPIRFRPNVAQDDLPRIDKMTNQVQYYRGVYPLEYTPDWLLGEQIVIQMQIPSLPFPKVMQVVTPTGTLNIVGTDVTPSIWMGKDIYHFTYTPTQSGIHQFRTIIGSSVDYDMVSDEFNVRNNDSDLVEFQYYDTKNSFDGVFYDNTTLIWQPKAYFTGIAMPGLPKRTLSTYTDDPGIPTITRGETQRTIDVNLTDITKHHYSQLIDILSCDTCFVNGQRALNVEDFDAEPVEKSDGTTMSMNMIRIEDDNFVKNL